MKRAAILATAAASADAWATIGAALTAHGAATTARSDAVAAAHSHSARELAARRLIANHAQVRHDLTNPNPNPNPWANPNPNPNPSPSASPNPNLRREQLEHELRDRLVLLDEELAHRCARDPEQAETHLQRHLRLDGGRALLVLAHLGGDLADALLLARELG